MAVDRYRAGEAIGKFGTVKRNRVPNKERPANVLLTRVAKWSALKAWGIRLAKRSGLRKAKSDGAASRCAIR
jgi:hypothetical protein